MPDQILKYLSDQETNKRYTVNVHNRYNMLVKLSSIMANAKGVNTTDIKINKSRSKENTEE